jgi:hypothetical protein
MEMNDGKEKVGRETVLSLHPRHDDMLFARRLNPETLAKYDEFSEPAKAEVMRWVGDYASKLIGSAYTVKENVNGDSVSEANVTEAAYSLNRREGTALRRATVSFGGILLGTAMSTLFGAVHAGKFDKDGTILIAVTGVIGAFLIAVDLPRRILPSHRKGSNAVRSKPTVRRTSVPRAPKSTE